MMQPIPHVGYSGMQCGIYIALALLAYAMWRFWPKDPLHDRLNYMAKLSGFASYAAYLDTPHWRHLKARTLKRYNGVCFVCGSAKDHICHHCSYDNFPHERDSDLVNLCHKCHSEVHVINRQEHIPLRQCHIVYKQRFRMPRSTKAQKKEASV